MFDELKKTAVDEFAKLKQELKSLHDEHLEELRRKLEEIRSKYSESISRLE